MCATSNSTNARLPPAIAWYVYAFVLPGEPAPVEGIDGHSQVILVTEHGIAAAASTVPLAEFGSEALRGNLENPVWLEQKVRRHEAIVEALLARGPVLPMRFGTIFVDLDRVRAVIASRSRALAEALRYVADKEEWGLKGFSHRASLRAAVLTSDPAVLALAGAAADAGPGHGFFARRKAEETLATRLLEREAELADDAVGAVGARVVKLVRNPLGAGLASEGELLALNLACLVQRTGVAAFLKEVERCNRDHLRDGFRLVPSGPWPPYHFTPELPKDG